MEKIEAGFEKEVTRVVETQIEELVIEWAADGSHRVKDKFRDIAGDWAMYQHIASLEMPDDLKSAETGRGYWMHLTHYYTGTLPTETLLEVY